jgi:hypothetical protein
MTDLKTTMPRFQKVFVARYSPQNECFARDGDVLYAPTSATQRASGVPKAYHFLSATAGDGKRSKFGWVKSAEQPFSVEDFVAEHPEIKKNNGQAILLATRFRQSPTLPRAYRLQDRILFAASSNVALG